MADQKTDALAALRTRVAAAEAAAEAALSTDDAEYADLLQREDAANERKRAALEGFAMAKMLDRLTVERAATNGAFGLDILNADEKTSGAGKYIIRSPTSASWKNFRELITRAKGDMGKADLAHRNFATECIVYPKIGTDLDMSDLADRYDRFAGLAGSIADFAGDLGAVAAGARKR